MTMVGLSCWTLLPIIKMGIFIETNLKPHREVSDQDEQQNNVHMYIASSGMNDVAHKMPKDAPQVPANGTQKILIKSIEMPRRKKTTDV